MDQSDRSMGWNIFQYSTLYSTPDTGHAWWGIPVVAIEAGMGTSCNKNI